MAQMVPRRDELRRLVALAVPIVTVQVGMMLMGVVDTVMVGRVSATDLAAVALGHLYFFGTTVFGLGTLFAVDPLVSQAVGAGEPVAISRAVQRGVVMAGILAVAATLLALVAEPVFVLFRQPPEVIPVAVGYVEMAAPGILPFYLFIVFRQTLQATGRLRAIVSTIVVANFANVGFNWVLVFGKLGAPAFGGAGAGAASSLSRWLMVALLLAAARRFLEPHLRPFRPEVLRWRPLARMFSLGAPVGGQFSLEFGAFAVTGLLMGWFGAVAMAGHQVAISLASLTFMVPVGVSQAAAVLVGRAVGRSDTPAARRAAGAGLLVGAGFMTTTALVFLLAPELLARVYSDEPAVLELAVLLIPLAGVFQVFDGLQVVAGAVLRGIGDTRGPMILIVVGFWAVGFPVSLFVAFGMDTGAVGLWWGLVAGLGAVAALLLGRVRIRFGRELRRVVVEEDVAPAGG